MAIVVLNSVMKPQPRIVGIPKVTVGEYSYNGKEQGPAITNLDSAHVEVRDAKHADVGYYMLVLRLRNRDTMTWTDGSNEDKQYTYQIQQGIITGNVSSFTVAFDDDNSEYDVNITNLTGMATKRAVRITSGIPDDRFTATVIQGTTSYQIHFKATDTGMKAGEWSSEIDVTILGDNNHKDLSGAITIKADYLVKRTFAQATPHQIEKMVKAADAGKIDLAKDCGWAVGQSTTFTIPKYTFSNDGVQGPSDTIVEILYATLLDTGSNSNYTLVSDNQKKPSFIIGLWADNKPQYQMESDSSKADNTINWSNTSLRTSLNGYILTYFKDHSIGNIFKKVRVPYNTTTSGNLSYSEDTLTIPSLNEITGNSRYAPDNTLKQFAYYVEKSAMDRHMNANNNFDKNAWYFWTRTKNGSSYFYLVAGSGDQTYGSEYAPTSARAIMILAFV